MKKNLVLLGMMAVGKTTLGKIVAKTKGLEFIDTDKTIEQKNSMTINEIFQPIMEIFRAIPPLAIAPILLIWFGPTSTSQYVMLISYTFLTLTVYTFEAVRNVDPLFIRYAQTMGANKKQIFQTIILPAIIPELIGGIRVSIALSWSIAVVSELLGAKLGIGKVFSMMLVAQGLDIIIISIIYVTFIAALTDQVFLAISNFFTKWVDRRPYRRDIVNHWV